MDINQKSTELGLGFFSKLLMGVIKVFLVIFDYLTLPIYMFICKPWEFMEKANRTRSKSTTGKPDGPYNTISHVLSPQQIEARKKFTTVYDAFEASVQKFSQRQCMGTREVVSEEKELQPDGKSIKKLVLGKYQWDSYWSVNKRVTNVGKGLRDLGIQPQKNVVIFAETRAEWMIACVACFKHNVIVCTLYATLPDEAVIFGLNETEAVYVITSRELISRFKSILPNCPNIKHIIYMDGGKRLSLQDYPSSVTITPFSSVEVKGGQVQTGIRDRRPTDEDIALIMYTSGSTGIPKGVIMTHGNLLNAMLSFSCGATLGKPKDIYAAFLPLAHVLEMLSEFNCILFAVPIGYSSPVTLLDKSPILKPGVKGDILLLKPTYIAAVPLILDRVHGTCWRILQNSTLIYKALFLVLFNYKLTWLKLGYSTFIADWLVFGSFQKVMGGRVRLVISGGAPLSRETHDFIRAISSAAVCQGYGLTETCAAATCCDEFDLSNNRVGPPLPGVDIYIADWPEAKYFATDKPNPRGEIWIAGKHVTKGYFKMEEKTKEDYVVKSDKRYFRTGDIAELFPDGVFAIIDRKKDLVKLAHGEYISLGKIEGELKSINVIDSICVYGDSNTSYIIALIVPNEKSLQNLASRLKKENISYEQMCNDPDIEKAVLKLIQKYAVKAKLGKFETPGKIKLIPEAWTPDTGLVTAAFKLKRKVIQTRYQEVITMMYTKDYAAAVNALQAIPKRR